MIASIQVTDNEIFAFMVVQAFKSLRRKVLFINRKDNRKCQKVGCYFKKINFTGKLLQNYK